MKNAAITILVLLITTLAASASAQHVFPPLVAGQYTIRAQQAAVPLDPDGVPLTPGAASISLVDVANPDLILGCVDAAPGEIGSLTVTVPSSGDRVEIRAIAHEGAGCVGQVSTNSANAAFVYFVGPPAPVIVE